MVPSIKFNSILLSLVLSIIQPGTVIAVESPILPRDYTATYRVLHNGNDLAEVTVRLSHQGNTWTLHGFTHDTRGLAGVLNIQGVQTTTGRWLGGRLVPEDYSFSFSLIGYKTAWNADFDWPSGIVTSTGKAWDTQLSLADGAVDPFSLSLKIQSQLAQNQHHMAINVLDEDEIDQQVYQADRQEAVDTALGCMDTTRVKRIRNSSKRTSMSWHANDHGYIPVLMRHSKKNGNDFKLQIISLEIDGQEVQALGHC